MANTTAMQAVINAAIASASHHLPDMSENDIRKAIIKAMKKPKTPKVDVSKDLVTILEANPKLTFKAWKMGMTAAWEQVHGKKEKSQFNVFKAERFPALKAEDPSRSFGDIIKLLAAEWKAMKEGTTAESSGESEVTSEEPTVEEIVQPVPEPEPEPEPRKRRAKPASFGTIMTAPEAPFKRPRRYAM